MSPRVWKYGKVNKRKRKTKQTDKAEKRPKQNGNNKKNNMKTWRAERYWRGKDIAWKFLRRAGPFRRKRILLAKLKLVSSNPLMSNIYCDDHSSLSSTTAVQKWIISYTSDHFTPHGRYELNKLTSLPMCGFIAQLVEQRTGNAEVTGSNPVEALIFFFSGFFFRIA